MTCKALLDASGETQASFSAAIGKSQSTISRVFAGKVDPPQSVIDAILKRFSQRLGRKVRYEEAFGSRPRRRAA